jgi:anti-sigma-K factor RskA
LTARDPDFAAEVSAWEQRFAPLLLELGGVEPSRELWPRILAALESPAPSADVLILKRRLRQWQWATAAASVAAALLLVGIDPMRTAPLAPPAARPAAPAPAMVASLMSGDKAMLLSATWEPETGSLMLTPGNLPPAAGHSHELWIIPADGKPRSLGIVSGAHPSRMTIPAAMKPHFARASTLAVSVEPEGGSPSDGPTGAVVASGALSSV